MQEPVEWVERSRISPAVTPNILLIIADQWRADCLGFDGHPVVETPHLDELFLGGTHFRRAYASCPTCIPARASLMTGLSPSSHGRTRYQDGVAWDYPVTLPRLLADAGYHTQCVGKMHVHPARNLLGYHHVVLHDGTLGIHRRSPLDYDRCDDYRRWLRDRTHGQADVRDTGLGVNSWVVSSWPYEEYLHPTNWVATESIEFLRRRDPTKPFFLTTSFVRPHPPLDPPDPFLRRFEARELPPVAMGDWADQRDEQRLGLRASFGRGCVSQVQRERARRAYFALMTHVDAQINRVLLELKDLGADEETVVIFVSDHGDLLGDHNLWGKALPYEGSARIPLIIRPPQAWGWPKQQVVPALVELCDLLPTLVDLSGGKIPGSVEGRSLVPWLRGEVPSDWRSHLHGEHEFGAESNHWLTDGREKYIWYPRRGTEQVFDLETDPREECNRLEEACRSGRLQTWRRILGDILDRRSSDPIYRPGAVPRPPTA